MRRFLSAALGFLLISAVIMTACTKNSNSSYSNNNNTNAVSIMNMQFTPGSITVTAGTTVTWTNNDNMTHNVTSNSGAFSSGNIEAGKTYSFTFNTKGTFPYTCTIHPGMTGTVIVN